MLYVMKFNMDIGWPKYLLKKVADAIFISHIRYGLPLYCPVRIEANDPTSGCIETLKVVFNDCLRLLSSVSRNDHESIAEMLKNLEWPSVNQLAAETRLIEAWKCVNQEDYCMREVLHLRPKGNYNTRQNQIDLLDTGVDDIYGSAGFVKTTAKLWNKAPMSIKLASSLDQAKERIKQFVREEIPI